MATDRSNERADRIVDAERARRPRWRSGPSTAPAWFSGEELELLEPPERDRLYLELRQHMPGTQWFPMVVALCNLSNAFHGLESERTRALWIAIVAGFAVLALCAWQYRRRGILAAARRHVRESADWPLRLQSHRPENLV
jgi:hypothetical protein